MGDPQQPNIMERIDSLCERYIDFFWDILTFKPVREPVRDLLQTSPRTRSWMEQGVTVFQGVTDSVMENSVGQWIKNHQKLVKVAVAAAACVAGISSLVSHPPTGVIWSVLGSAACLPVAEHYRHKSNSSTLTQKEQLFKTTASVLHVAADVVTIGVSLFSAVLQTIQSQHPTPLLEAVEHPFVDKLGDRLAVAGAQGLTTKRDTFYGVAAKVTTSVLTVAALHNVVAAVVPTVSGVYLTVYALWACFKAGQCLLSTNKGARFAATAAAAASVLLGGVVPPSLTPPQLAGPPVPTPVTSPPPTHTVTIPEGGVTITEGGTLWEAVKNSGTCPEQNPKQDICIANVIKTLADNGAGNVNLVYPGETVTVTETSVGVLVSFRRVTAQVHER